MSSCEDPETEFLCRATAENTLNYIVYPSTVVNGKTYDGKLIYDFSVAVDTYNCAKAKFDSIIGGDLTTEVRSQLVKILKEGSAASVQVVYILFGGIAIIFVLLTLIIFAALYWINAPYGVAGFFVLALLVLIAAFLIMYLWISSIYDTTSDMIATNLNNIDKISTKVKSAILPTICCIGGIKCGPGDCSCPTHPLK